MQELVGAYTDATYNELHRNILKMYELTPRQLNVIRHIKNDPHENPLMFAFCQLYD